MNTEEISRRVMDAADAVSKKTAGLIEEGKLLFKVREIERSIEKCYRNIGKHIYENNRHLLDGSMDEIADEIDVLSDQLVVLRREYAQVRGMKLCENCGSMNNEKSIFCDQCGEKFY